MQRTFPIKYPPQTKRMKKKTILQAHSQDNMTESQYLINRD